MTPLRRTMLATLLATGLGAAEPAAPIVLNPCDAQLDYAYLAWQDKVRVADGKIVLKGLKCTGGGGVNGTRDLTASANRTPALVLRANPGNTAAGLTLIISDADGRSGRFLFKLPAPETAFTTILPTGAVAAAEPNAVEDKKAPETPGRLDLAKVSQYQLVGDWSKAELDIEIDAIVLVEPDAAMLAARAAYATVRAEEEAARKKKAEDEKAALAKKRQNMIWSYKPGRAEAPVIVETGLAAPDVIALTIEAQQITPSALVKYEPQPGDVKQEEKWPDGGGNNGVRRAKLIRDGKNLGTLQGKDLDWLFVPETIIGDPFLDFVADEAAKYTISSPDDPAFAAGVKPVALWRKTKPTNVRMPWGAFSTRHRIYLKVPGRILAGKTYAITTDGINVTVPNPQFTADFARMPSESVHVNQNGYRPDDPCKRAILSVWLGTGGAYRFPDGLTFSLVDEASRAAVFTGTVEQVMAVDGAEQLWTVPAKNHARTAVYRMDFGAFTTPGTYRVCVDGVGVSPPFEIGRATWERAFLTQMKGLYNNRSGIEIGPPYSDFKKPRDFHPDDGAVVTRTTHDVATSGQYGALPLPERDTGEKITNAWGGYHDAGDWNPRRVSHMITTLAQLELVEIHPAYFNQLKLSIPRTEGIPDVITEALWEIDCFRRLQLPDGGIPYGIESQTDPGSGEVSWLSTQHLYVLAPNMRDSWFYAAVAGRAAKVLRPIKPELAKIYEDSAVRAHAWAEADHAKRVAAKTLDTYHGLWQAIDARNLSSLVLYDLTGGRSYHDAFMATTCLKNPDEDLCAWDKNIQTDAAFLYARLDDAKADPLIKKNAIAAVLKLADFSMAYAAGNAFGITCREKGRPMFAGFFSVSGGMEVARAHFLTGKQEYLAGAVQSCQFGLGCNPNNLVYTTGLGSNPVRNPLHLDARSSGQPVPPGITVFGNTDYWNHRGGFWDINLHGVNQPEVIWPNAYDWPIQEAYFDVWILVSANEFVIDTWQQNVFTWGYLAARP